MRSHFSNRDKTRVSQCTIYGATRDQMTTAFHPNRRANRGVRQRQEAETCTAASNPEKAEFRPFQVGTPNNLEIPQLLLNQADHTSQGGTKREFPNAPFMVQLFAKEPSGGRFSGCDITLF